MFTASTPPSGTLIRPVPVEGQSGFHRAFKQKVLQALPLHVLHRDVGMFIPVVDLEDGGDIRVVEGSGGLCFAGEPLFFGEV